MSSAREIAGSRARAGRKATHIPVWSKAEEETLRRNFHDFERRKGRRVRRAAKPQWGNHAASRGKRSRLRPTSWHSRFVLALARTGDRKAAALMVGVPYSTVKKALRVSFSRKKDLRELCLVAESEHLLRMLEQVAKGQVDRWELSPRKARAILVLMKGGAA